MQAEGAPRQFFFDDEDLSIKFCFQASEEKHEKDLKMAPILKDTFHLPPSQGEPARNATFALHNKLLVKYKDELDAVPESVLDLSYSRLKLLKPEGENLESGFSVTKNGNSFEFYHTDKQTVDNWYDALKKICVLTSFHDDFKAIKMIGRGSFAKVYLVESKETGKSYAVKAFTKDSMNVSNKANAKPSMLNEIGIMREVDHENIIKLYEVYETEKSIYLVLELIQGKSLYDLLKKSNREEVTPTKIINMIRSMLDALAYLAAKGIMHRDLKPDNILLDKGEKVKLVDFGLATFIDVPAYIFKKCGTPGYIAPEVFKYDDKDPTTGYNDRCDAFSVGCLLYYMLFNTPFFGGATAADILKLNRKYVADFPVLNSIKLELKDSTSKLPKDALNLLLDLLEFDAKKRMTSSQALNHPYFIPCPSGMQKVVGTNEFYVEALTQYSQNEIFSPCSPLKLTPLIQDQVYSPLTPLRVDSFGGESPLLPKKDRFMKEDSLYLDLGKPEINGRTDTITCGSTNNSILLGARVDSSNNIGSTCLPSAFGNRSISRSNSKTYKPHAQGGSNQNILKLTLLRNMQRNNSEISREEDTFKSRMDDLKVTRTASETSPSQNDESNENIRINIIDGAENDNTSQEGHETPSNGNPKSRFNVAKLHLVTDRNYGTKPTPSKIKRFQPFAPLSANLPKSQTDNDI